MKCLKKLMLCASLGICANNPPVTFEIETPTYVGASIVESTLHSRVINYLSDATKRSELESLKNEGYSLVGWLMELPVGEHPDMHEFYVFKGGKVYNVDQSSYIAYKDGSQILVKDENSEKVDRELSKLRSFLSHSFDDFLIKKVTEQSVPSDAEDKFIDSDEFSSLLAKVRVDISNGANPSELPYTEHNMYAIINMIAHYSLEANQKNKAYETLGVIVAPNDGIDLNKALRNATMWNTQNKTQGVLLYLANLYRTAWDLSENPSEHPRIVGQAMGGVSAEQYGFIKDNSEKMAIIQKFGSESLKSLVESGNSPATSNLNPEGIALAIEWGGWYRTLATYSGQLPFQFFVARGYSYGSLPGNTPQP